MWSSPRTTLLLRVLVFGAAVAQPKVALCQIDATSIDPDVVYKVELEGSEPQLGPDDALVTIVEFGTVSSSTSARMRPTLDALRKKYGSNVRVVWKNNTGAYISQAEGAAT